MNDTACIEDLAECLRSEQGHLWDELHDAIDSSIDGAWSMRCGRIAYRIIRAARLVGPTPHDTTPWPLVAGGVYEAVLTAGGLHAALPDEREWQRLDALMVRPRSGDHARPSRAQFQQRYAATVAVINSPRESAWISEGDEQ